MIFIGPLSNCQISAIISAIKD